MRRRVVRKTDKPFAAMGEGRPGEGASDESTDRGTDDAVSWKQSDRRARPVRTLPKHGGLSMWFPTVTFATARDSWSLRANRPGLTDQFCAEILEASQGFEPDTRPTYPSMTARGALGSTVTTRACSALPDQSTKGMATMRWASSPPGGVGSSTRPHVACAAPTRTPKR